eukprot:Clim_evm21s156 gene=Clim_evmTU21s156
MVDRKDNGPKDVDVKKMLGPLAGQLTLGVVAGYCSGYALKTIGKGLALIFGISFISLQLAQYKGYIKVEWSKINDKLNRELDRTGDGRFDQDDLKYYIKRGLEILQYNLPGGSGFVAGLMYGMS